FDRGKSIWRKAARNFRQHGELDTTKEAGSFDGAKCEQRVASKRRGPNDAAGEIGGGDKAADDGEAERGRKLLAKRTDALRIHGCLEPLAAVAADKDE